MKRLWKGLSCVLAVLTVSATAFAQAEDLPDEVLALVGKWVGGGILTVEEQIPQGAFLGQPNADVHDDATEIEVSCWIEITDISPDEQPDTYLFAGSIAWVAPDWRFPTENPMEGLLIFEHVTLGFNEWALFTDEELRGHFRGIYEWNDAAQRMELSFLHGYRRVIYARDRAGNATWYTYSELQTFLLTKVED
jgi:hypothetical protein